MKSGNSSDAKEEAAATDPNEKITVETLLSEAESKPTAQEGAESLIMMLTGTDINSIALYDKYGALYEEQVAYNNSAREMALDPYNTYQGRYLYLVKAKSSEALESVLTTYKLKLNDQKEIYGPLYSFSASS